MGKHLSTLFHSSGMRIFGRLVQSFAGASSILFITDTTEPQFASLLVFLLLFLLLRPRAEQPEVRLRITVGIQALVYAGATVCARYTWLAEQYGFFSTHTALQLFFCWVFYRAVLILLYTRLAAGRLGAEPERKRLSPGWVFLSGFLVLLGVYTVCFLSNYPGNVMADSRTQLAQIVGLDPYSNHHPMAHTLLMKVFFDLGYSLFHSQNAGVACITVSQYVAVAAVFAFCLSTMARFKVRNWFLIVSLLFFALAPNNLLFAITIVKDIPFGIMAVLMLTVLWRLVAPYQGAGPLKWLEYGLLGLSCLGVCVFRTNGIYAFVVFLPLCLIFLPKKSLPGGERAGFGRWALLAPMGGALLLALLFRGPVLTGMGVTPPDTIEALSVPAQHIARVVADGCALSPEDEALLNQIVDVDRVPETYESYIADPIKELVREKGNQAYLKEHGAEYLRLWLRLLIQYPKEYLFAQIDETVGFWYPNVEYTSLYLGGIHPESTRLDIATEPVLTGELPALLTAWLTGGHIVPVYGLIYCIGTATWVGLALFGLAVIRRRTWQLLPSLFVFLVFATLMAATPVHAEFRYLYALFAALPILVCMPFAGDAGDVA